MSTPARPVRTVEEAHALLAELGAERLITDGHLVLEAADALLAKVRALGLPIDEALVRAGAMLHDVGKLAHPTELRAPGAEHEPTGQERLLERGVDPRVARHCIAHARWASMEVSIEELLVALADALWKGVRRPELEKRVVDEVAKRVGGDAWAVLVDLDGCFEAIADGGAERLARS